MAHAALDKQAPERLRLEEVSAFIEARRQGESTPRQADTLARMQEALVELLKLAPGG